MCISAYISTSTCNNSLHREYFPKLYFNQSGFPALRVTRQDWHEYHEEGGGGGIMPRLIVRGSHHDRVATSDQVICNNHSKAGVTQRIGQKIDWESKYIFPDRCQTLYSQWP